MTELSAAIETLPGVEKRQSRFSSAPAYVINGREFAHFHGGHEIDIRLTRSGVTKYADLMQDSRVIRRPGSSDWIAVRLISIEDVEFALELVRLALEMNRK